MAKLLIIIFVSATYAQQVLAEDEIKELKDEVKKLKSNLQSISRQLMLQQFFTEEKIRNDGFSGIKQIRTAHGGLKNYFSNTQSGASYCAIHDHSNNIRTVGMGEFIGVLNGVEFRTRHNDFRLNQPHSTKDTLHAIEPIRFPDVPPEVTNQPNTSAQIQEMREWFKAWKNSDHSKRDYRKYFQPVLCYLEGAWTTKRGDSIDEPFESDRHSLDAFSWFDLQEKTRFTSYTGTKSLSENLAFLPTTIMRFQNDSQPVFAQWNYRILCHKLKTPVPLKKLRPTEDLASRMTKKIDMEKYKMSRAARFELDTDLSPDSDRFQEKPIRRGFIDLLMEEVPGKNNYVGKLYDGGFDAEVLNMDGETKKDVSRYHRWFKLKTKDAMGRQDSHRGYADQFLFGAKTTQDRISGLRMNVCFKHKRTKKKECQVRDEKWSYAVPLEIIYLTPLNTWNPYNIQIKQSCLDQLNTADNRTGNRICKDMSKAKRFACDKFYYLTPDAFFSGKEVDRDPADTARSGGVCMLNKEGEGIVVRATGTRIMLPEISGVGRIRQRYPISPIHGEGSPIWKNLNALRDIVMYNESYQFMKSNEEKKVDKSYTFELPMSTNPKYTPHSHFFTLVKSDIDLLMNRKKLTVDTEIRESHSHTIKVRYHPRKKVFQYITCDGLSKCIDWHPRDLNKVEG